MRGRWDNAASIGAAVINRGSYAVSSSLTFSMPVDSCALVENKTPTKEENNNNNQASVRGCFTIPFPCFPFCHFSIILGISVRQALFLKLPLFHGFLYFMISTSSSSVVQTEVEAWGNLAAPDMQTTSWWDLRDPSVLLTALWWEKKEQLVGPRGHFSFLITLGTPDFTDCT